jgi:hypothetical protein
MVTAEQPRARILDPDGSFSGYIGILKDPDPIIFGNISGEYKMGKRIGGINGSFDISFKNQSVYGTMRCLFGKRIFLGKLAIEGFNRTLPVIGFIQINKDNLTFKGRAMSFKGPAPHFWGTYEPY